jgi:hypothetical protein
VVVKLRRLMLPWVIAVSTLIPLYRVIFLYSRGLPQEHWITYSHISNPNSQNWLWFLPVLFVFSMLYLLLARAEVQFPKVARWVAVAGAFALALVYSFGIGYLVDFRSWTLTPLLDLERAAAGLPAGVPGRGALLSETAL